jgi:hypothetical protein
MRRFWIALAVGIGLVVCGFILEDTTVGIAALLIGFLILLVLPSVAVATYAASKGRSFAGFLILSLLLSPIVGVVAAAAVAERPVRPSARGV